MPEVSTKIRCTPIGQEKDELHVGIDEVMKIERFDIVSYALSWLEWE